MWPLRIGHGWSTLPMKKTPLRRASKPQQGQQEEAEWSTVQSEESALRERALPSVWHFRSQRSFQDSPRNKWVHLVFVLWLQKLFHHLLPAGPSGSRCCQKSELCTDSSLCTPLPLANPAFCSGNVSPALLFGTPEVCSRLWLGFRGLRWQRKVGCTPDLHKMAPVLLFIYIQLYITKLVPIIVN